MKGYEWAGKGQQGSLQIIAENEPAIHISGRRGRLMTEITSRLTTGVPTTYTEI